MKNTIIAFLIIIPLLLSSCNFFDDSIWTNPPEDQSGIEPFQIFLSNDNLLRYQEVILSINRSLKADETIEWYHNSIMIGKSNELAWSFDAGTNLLEARIYKNNLDVVANNHTIIVSQADYSYYIEESDIIIDLNDNVPTISFTVGICRRNYSDPLQECIKEAQGVSLEIENINNEKAEFALQNNEYFPAYWSNSLDFQNFKEQVYKVHLKISANDNMSFRINNVDTFSGEYYRTCMSDSDCKLYINNKNYHSCEDNICVLKNSTYKVGVVYVYSSMDNFNLNWKIDLEPVFERTRSYIGRVTDNRIVFDYEFLDSYQTDLFCWNPSVLGLEYTPTPLNDDTQYLEAPASKFYIAKGQHFQAKDYYVLDSCTNCVVEKIEKINIEYGSNVCTFIDDTVSHGICYEKYKPFRCNGRTGELIADCEYCGCEEPFICDSYSGECVHEGTAPYFFRSLCPEDKLLTSDNFRNNIYELRENINLQLGLNDQEYDAIILIFGRLGPLKPESDKDIDHLCQSGSGYIGGFSSLEFAENGLYYPYIVNCSSYQTVYENHGYYIPGGGHKTIIHEIIHRFGSLDIYEWHGLLGGLYSTEYARKVASEIDKDFRMSIMGDDQIPCMNGSEWFYDTPECGMDELNEVYLDVFNQRLIGLKVPENR